MDTQEPRLDMCGSGEAHRALMKQAERYRYFHEEQQRFADAFADRYARTSIRSNVVVIPVVVHIVMQNTATVTDAQVHSQIAVVNQDFRRLNPDAGSVPPRFASLAADCRIQFQLAARDPSCNPTTGIHRVTTSVAKFTYDRANPTTPAGTPVKFPSEGGVAPWPRDQYLNIWVCNLGRTPVGYATFPGFPANVDGVVVDHTCFGTTGSVQTPLNRGRATTHEIGHWLNLRHIWGDDEGEPDPCSVDDLVADTPLQAVRTDFCPSASTITVSCSNGPDGNMFMNYMDATFDACKFMFTPGQSTRMDATLFTTVDGGRAAILGSNALVPPTGVPASDLWSSDTPTDVGAEPDTSSTVMWDSNDIWVRHQQDGIENQDHENPEHRPARSAPNYVYVRVRNRGCGSAGSGTLKLYWAKASTALSWPPPWDGSVTSPALMGGQIGAAPTGAVPAGGFTIFEFPWMPPDPADYSSFGGDQAHFCLLARIETSATAPFGMTTPEGPNLYLNVQNNNNIAWKNVTIMDEEGGGAFRGGVSIGNFGEKAGAFRLELSSPGRSVQRPVLDWSDVLLDLPERLHARWVEAGSTGSGLKPVAEHALQLVESAGWLGGLKLEPGELHTVTLRARPHPGGVPAYQVFLVDLTQRSEEDRARQIVGGQRFAIKTRNRAMPRR